MQLSRIKALTVYEDIQALRSQCNSYEEDDHGRVCEKSFPSQSINKLTDNDSNTNNEDGVKVLINMGGDGHLCIQRLVGRSKAYSYIKLNEVLSQLDINFDDILLANSENKILGNANSYGVHNIVQLSNLIKQQQQQENQYTPSLSTMWSENAQQIAQSADSIQQTSFTDPLLGGQDSRILFHPVRLSPDESPQKDKNK
ncbi:hypothetical protein HWQ46_13010 [Shewanella sp. D64]|uniref:hypothetical protein n=1 Tax=unclassified Shewanella TaxID=196818 RepID=UPI0022BA6A1A|nr:MULTISPECIES: hypothetical protein [unclassified Shewanella]MEC4726470.1 hypothetical protein [Shewanella sp. D64]MEC4738482.1 hypothetical protein [Shewanella sp. E94]WBJ94118.1 hypothetical protein HWQ47_19775 [Shewanella sp. MTB7]